MFEDTEILRRIAIVNAYIAQTNLRVEGMKAENENLKYSGLPPRYMEKDFLNEDMTNHILSLLQL